MIKFKDIQAYLDAIAAKNGHLDDSPHGAFWNAGYDAFKTGTVPNVGVPIMDLANPLQSPFYLILINSAGFGGNRQMPGGGPWITNPGYEVTLADGSKITGSQIQANIASWLSNGFPQ